MKISALVAATSISLICVPYVEANLPPLLTLKEKVELSKYIFIGVAEKAKIYRIDPKHLYPAPKESTRSRMPPFPPGPYRLIEFDVRVVEKLKSGKHCLPKRMKLRLLRAFSNDNAMKQEVAHLLAKSLKQKHLYLVDRIDLFFTEDLSMSSQIKKLVQTANSKSRK